MLARCVNTEKAYSSFQRPAKLVFYRLQFLDTLCIATDQGKHSICLLGDWLVSLSVLVSSYIHFGAKDRRLTW